MKFAALALTLLLAVGCHGDAQLGVHVKGMLPQIRDVVQRVVDDGLKGTEYDGQRTEIKERVSTYVDLVTGFLDSDEAKQGFAKVDEVLNRWRNSELRTTLLARFSDYKALFENFYKENEGDFNTLRQQIVDMINNNYDNTRRVLEDAAVTVRAELETHVQNFRAVAQGQADEYVEQMKRVFDQAQRSNLRDTTAPKFEVIREKLGEIYSDIFTAFTQQ